MHDLEKKNEIVGSHFSDPGIRWLRAKGMLTGKKYDVQQKILATFRTTNQLELKLVYLRMTKMVVVFMLFLF